MLNVYYVVSIMLISPLFWVSLCWVSWRRFKILISMFTFFRAALCKLIFVYHKHTLFQGIPKGEVDLLFDCFGISCMTTDNFCFYLQNRLIQTSQTGGQWYSDNSPYSIPCGLYYKCLTIVIYNRNDVASTIKQQLWL